MFRRVVPFAAAVFTQLFALRRAVRQLVFVIILTVVTLYIFYETSIGKVTSVPRIASVKRTVRERGQYTSCSMNIITDHIAVSSDFPGQGNWAKSGDSFHFVPTLCTFPYVTLPSNYLYSCVKEKQVSSVLLLGDSNGRRYYDAFYRTLQKVRRYNCTTVKQVVPYSTTPVAAYYAQGTNISVSDIVVHQRDCRSCNNILSNCTHPTANPFVLEYLSMEFLIDTEVATSREPHVHQSNTYQEFIFDEYLPGTVGYYPDIIVIFGNSHEIFRNNPTKVKNDLKYLLGIIQRSVPQSTKVVWIPVHGHYTLKEKYVNWEKLAAVNRAWFEILKPHIVRESRTCGFFDLQALSREVLPRWTSGEKQGVHLLHVWYDRVVSYLMQTLCNGDSEINSNND